MPPLSGVDPSFKLDEYDFDSGKTRKPMAVSLGPHYVGASCPLPDITHGPSGLMGVTKRIACAMPEVDLDLMAEFINYSIEIIHAEFSHCIISPTEDISVETWLKGAPYTVKRKKMLQEISEKRPYPKNGDLFVKSHIKHEPYLWYRWLRGIYSRSDFFKTFIGPICALIGSRLFDHKAFIKKIPVADRPAFIKERYSVPGIKMAANDFTSFESMFKELQMVVEVYFFFYCTQYLGNGSYYTEIMRRIKMGKNFLVFRKWRAWLVAKRYSGEMDTSSMNGLFNYLLIRFLLHKSGETHSIPPTVEGDDSLNAFFGELDESILVRLGAKAKLEYFDDVFSASFCGMVFAADSCQIITDPIKAMLNFGYSNQFYLKSNQYKLSCLLRAKSLSMLYTYPGCPILTKLATYGLRVSGQCSDRDLFKYYCRDDPYLREKFSQVLSVKRVAEEPSLDTRLLFEDKYKICVSSQITIETYLDSLQTLTPIKHELIDLHLHPDQIDYYYRYCHDIDPDNYMFL